MVRNFLSSYSQMMLIRTEAFLHELTTFTKDKVWTGRGEFSTSILFFYWVDHSLLLSAVSDILHPSAGIKFLGVDLEFINLESVCGQSEGGRAISGTQNLLVTVDGIRDLELRSYFVLSALMAMFDTQMEHDSTRNKKLNKANRSLTKLPGRLQSFLQEKLNKIIDGRPYILVPIMSPSHDDLTEMKDTLFSEFRYTVKRLKMSNATKGYVVNIGE